MANKYYGRLDNGTNPQAVMYPDEKHLVPKSYFDLSSIVTQTQTLGGLYPFFLLRTVPNDNFEIGVDVLVTVSNPFVRRMLSTLNITTHFYYDRMSHLWEGGKNHFTKGRTGNITITFPYVDLNDTGNYAFHLAYDAAYPGAVTTPTSWDCVLSFNNQMSLASYLGVPPQFFQKSVDLSGNPVKDVETSLISGLFSHYHVFVYGGLASGFGSSDLIPYPSVGDNPANLRVNALPFAMYQKIYAESYAPKNLLVNNKNWYPDNPDDFILPYASGGQAVRIMSRSKSQSHFGGYLHSTVPLGKVTEDPSYVNCGYDDVTLLSLRFRQWQGDYFTASVPWITRGDMYRVDFSDLGLLPVKTMLNDGASEYSAVESDSNGATRLSLASFSSRAGVAYTDSSTTWSNLGTPALYADASGSTFALTANQIYELLALSRWQERNTRTDGDYNSLIKTHFNFDPNSEDWHSVYIGGSFTRMQFSEVLQTNQDSSSITPLGSQVSRGVANQSGYVGKFTSPDFGYIMGICSIIPNTFYSQGLSRVMWWNSTNEDEYYPEFNSMAPQAILNKEIFYDLDQNNVNVNDDVFAYTERFADYKFMPNRVAGSFTAPPSVSLEWSAYSFARYFSSTPLFNSKFVTCYGFRRDMWSTPLNPEFIVQIAVKCDAIRPIPYDSIPGGNINV